MHRVGKLTVETPGDREIVMTRVFDAPRENVFKALTIPALILQWFDGPPGWKLVTCEYDARVGGTYRYVWRGPDGAEMGMGGTITEFTPPSRIGATEKFDQAWYPGDAFSSIDLTETGGKTTLRMVVTYASKAARDEVLKTPMDQGVAAGYDSLEAFLAKGK